ncbi:MAG: hypothetical protein AAF456_24680 [Planctomycetota bacterium]
MPSEDKENAVEIDAGATVVNSGRAIADGGGKSANTLGPKLIKKLARPSGLSRLIQLTGDSTTSPLTWLMPEELVETEAHAAIQKWHTSVRKQKKTATVAAEVEEFLSEVRTDLDISKALLAVAAARTLRSIATQLLDLSGRFEELLALADGVTDFEHHPWMHQLLGVELPLTLAFDLPEFGVSDQAIARAVARFEECTGELMDGDGLIDHRYLSVYGPLTACWARCHALAVKLKLEFREETRVQLEWLARTYMMMLRPDGTFGGSGYDSLPAPREMTQTVLKMTPDKLDKKVAEVCCFGEKRKLRTEPHQSGLSEWADTGILQANWKPGTGKCFLTFGNRKCWMEVCREINLLGGDCTPQVTFNDETLSIADNVEVVCWEQQDEGDLVELSFSFGNGVQLERQIYLARDDDFLLIGDAIRSEEAGRFSYRCDYHLAPGVEGLPETETREIYLKDKKIRSLVLPLGLPEWKAARTAGSLTCRDGMLTLTQTAENQTGLYAGLFFDLNRKRSHQPRTWRQLTVGESLQKVRPDVAVAFRVRVGDDQWVMYRSLGEKANRSFIGYNIYDGFFIGRFEEDGQIERMIEVE